MSGEWLGMYRGIVTNDNDPEGLGRVKAICPQVFGNDTTETAWAWPCIQPGAGSTTPNVPIPAVGVWLMFEGGDLDYPIWTGVWNTSAQSGSVIPTPPPAQLTLAQVFNAVYPVGSVYINAVNATNPGTLFGVGTWVAHGPGRTLISLGSNGVDNFPTAGVTAGSSTAMLTHTHTGPSHQHGVDGGAGSGVTSTERQAHNHTSPDGQEFWMNGSSGVAAGGDYFVDGNQGAVTQTENQAHDHSIGADGTQPTGAPNIGVTTTTLPPYIVAYMWRRTV